MPLFLGDLSWNDPIQESQNKGKELYERFIENIKVNGLLRQIDRRRQQSRRRKKNKKNPKAES